MRECLVALSLNYESAGQIVFSGGGSGALCRETLCTLGQLIADDALSFRVVVLSHAKQGQIVDRIPGLLVIGAESFRSQIDQLPILGLRFGIFMFSDEDLAKKIQYLERIGVLWTHHAALGIESLPGELFRFRQAALQPKCIGKLALDHQSGAIVGTQNPEFCSNDLTKKRFSLGVSRLQQKRQREIARGDQRVRVVGAQDPSLPLVQLAVDRLGFGKPVLPEKRIPQAVLRL